MARDALAALESVTDTNHLGETMKQEEEMIEKAKSLYLTSRALIALCRQRTANFSINGVSPIQLQICHVVQQHETVTVTEIAEQLSISAPYASNKVDDLVNQSILKREKNTYDRRKCVITIDPKAAKTIEAMELDLLYPIYMLLEMVGAEETKKWTAVFRQIDKEMARLV